MLFANKPKRADLMKFFLVALTLNAQPLLGKELYQVKGSDPSWESITQEHLIPINEKSTAGITGSSVDVDNKKLETGAYGSRPIASNIGIHTLGNDYIPRQDFSKWSRWYQEEGKTQIFRLFKGEHNVQNKRRPAPRIEAETENYNDGSNTKGPWVSWSGRYTISENHQGNYCIFQIWGYATWKPNGSGLMMLDLHTNGDVSWNNRQGGHKTILQNQKGKSFDILVRDNGVEYEVYANGNLVGSHPLAERLSPSHFRWGLYGGANDVTEDVMLFVSGAQFGSVATSSTDSHP